MHFSLPPDLLCVFYLPVFLVFWLQSCTHWFKPRPCCLQTQALKSCPALLYVTNHCFVSSTHIVSVFPSAGLTLCYASPELCSLACLAPVLLIVAHTSNLRLSYRRALSHCLRILQSVLKYPNELSIHKNKIILGLVLSA